MTEDIHRQHRFGTGTYFFIGWVSFLFLTVAGYSQEAEKYRDLYFTPGIRINYGFIIPHAKEMKKAATSYPIGYQADFNWHLNTQKGYDFCNCYPRIGFSMYYWDYRNDPILGKGFTIMGFAEPVFNIHHRVQFSLRPAFGFAYLNNPFDSLSNPYNLAYSTRITYSLLLNFTTYINLTDQLILNAAFNYNHVSNGGVKQPNKGLNFPTLSVGLDYSIQPRKFREFASEKEEIRIRKNNILISAFVGFKGLNIDNKTYTVFGFLGKYQFQLDKHSYVTGGMEFNIDQTKYKIREVYLSTAKNAAYIMGLTGGYEHVLGRFRAVVDLGAYLHNPERELDLIFQRYGVKFHPWAKMSMGLFLRAHRHSAEFFDVRIGYIL